WIWFGWALLVRTCVLCLHLALEGFESHNVVAVNIDSQKYITQAFANSYVDAWLSTGGLNAGYFVFLKAFADGFGISDSPGGHLALVIPSLVAGSLLPVVAVEYLKSPSIKIGTALGLVLVFE